MLEEPRRDDRLPGAGRAKEALMLARHGYGVLLLVPRGQGASEGDIVRWAGDADLLAGADYLRNRPDVDETGSAPSASRSEASSCSRLPLGRRRSERSCRKAPVDAWARPTRRACSGRSSSLDARDDHRDDRVPEPRSAPADRGAHRIDRASLRVPHLRGARHRRRGHQAAHVLCGCRRAEGDVEVPGSEHTGGIEAQPAEYERRVIEFVDRALLDRR